MFGHEHESDQSKVFSGAGRTEIAGKYSSPQIVREQRPSLITGKRQLMKVTNSFEVPHLFSMTWCHRSSLTDSQALAEPVAHLGRAGNGKLASVQTYPLDVSKSFMKLTRASTPSAGKAL